jgi:hypothetical protein
MASGDTLGWIHPLANEAKAANYATLVVRNDRRMLSFDGATTQGSWFMLVMPSWYSGGGISIYVHWAAASGTTGAVVWGAAFESLAPGAQSLDSDLFGTETLQSGSVPATAGETEETILSISSANMASAAAGDPCRIKLRRAPADASDTLSVAAHLLIAEIRET